MLSFLSTGSPKSSPELIVSALSILQGLPKEPSASSSDSGPPGSDELLSIPCLVAALSIRKPIKLDHVDSTKTIPVEDCSAHTTCEDCLGVGDGVGDPYCGWCSLQKKYFSTPSFSSMSMAS